MGNRCLVDSIGRGQEIVTVPDSHEIPLPTPEDFPPQRAAVQRTDLALRARYPQLETRIFQVGAFEYRIVFDDAILRADVIREEFANSIRPITVPVDVSNEVPSNFLREIRPLADHQIAFGFAGLPFTRDDLRTVLYGKFPRLPNLTSVDNVRHPTLTLAFERELTLEEKKSVTTFFERWESGWPIEFAVATSAEKLTTPPATIGADALRIMPARLRKRELRFVEEDEAYWFDHVDALFEGALGPEHVLDLERLGTSCYVDATIFPQIDLRQAILCYDTVLLSPPLVDADGQSFWERQALTREDFVQLAALDRVRFVLRQAEERTDVALLQSIYEVNPGAIIGRRRASALLAADLVQTANEYRFNAVARFVPELSRLLAPELNVPESELVQMLLWPNAARRSCLLPLMSDGLMSIGSFGQGKLLGDQLQRITSRDLRLEAFAVSDGVHIAHAFSSTLIPPLDEQHGFTVLRRIVGERLNFYRSFNARITAAWAENERRREEKVRLLPAIPVFEFDRHASVGDLISLTSYQSTRRKGRALLSRLSQLPLEERALEVERLSNELYELGVRKERRAMLLDTLDDLKEVGAAALDITLAPVRSVWNITKAVLRVGRKIPAIDNFMDDLERDTLPSRYRNSDLDFLSKIERVAELRLPEE